MGGSAILLVDLVCKPRRHRRNLIVVADPGAALCGLNPRDRI